MDAAAFRALIDTQRADANELPLDAEILPSVAALNFRLKNLEREFAFHIAEHEAPTWRTRLRRLLRV